MVSFTHPFSLSELVIASNELLPSQHQWPVFISCLAKVLMLRVSFSQPFDKL